MASQRPYLFMLLFGNTNVTDIIHFIGPLRISMFPDTKSWKASRFEGRKLFPKEPVIKCSVI